jgi:Predicted membrane protein (DUF2207) C-terminal domain
MSSGNGVCSPSPVTRAAGGTEKETVGSRWGRAIRSSPESRYVFLRIRQPWMVIALHAPRRPRYDPPVRGFLAPLALMGSVGPIDRVLIAVGSVLTAGWLAVVGVIRVVREPRNPRPSVETMDLGPEPPALVNLLTRNYRVTPDAVPATLLDLAARRVGIELEQTHPGAYACRLRPESPSIPGGVTVTPYEERILDFVQRRAVDGVVSSRALTTGPQDESKRWFRGFAAEVVADAQARGLSRDLWDRRTLTFLYAAASVPAVPFGLAGGWWAFLSALIGGLAVVGGIDASRRQRETPAGLEAGGRWLGVRAKLAQDEVFPTLPPTGVAVWERYLAYGAAMGVARAAVAELPMGAESDTRAWSSYGGEWHEVRVRYPFLWPPAWGSWPPLGVALGFVGFLAGGLVLFLVARFGVFSATDSVTSSVLAILVPIEIALGAVGGLVLVWGSLCLVSALADLRKPSEVEGQILRLRVRGTENHPRHYVGVDDGRSTKVQAWRVSPELYAGLQQGETVRAVVTRLLGHVRSVEPSGGDDANGTVRPPGLVHPIDPWVGA